jgi:hypothetical protein
MTEADAAARAVLLAGFGDDLHILVKRRHKSHQALDGNSVTVAAIPNCLPLKKATPKDAAFPQHKPQCTNAANPKSQEKQKVTSLTSRQQTKISVEEKSLNQIVISLFPP